METVVAAKGDTAPQDQVPRPWGSGTQSWGEADLERYAYYYGNHSGNFDGTVTFPVRVYKADVLDRLDRLSASSTCVQVSQYGKKYSDPGFEFRKVLIGRGDGAKPIISIRGGVHGYEQGGVEIALSAAEILAGATDLLRQRWANLMPDQPGYASLDLALRTFGEMVPRTLGAFDIVIHPCVSPVPYAFNERWNMGAQDPNRHFSRDVRQLQSGRPAPESEAFMDSIEDVKQFIRYCHDCHETTVMDREHFRAMKKFRDGQTDEVDPVIPEGFYLVLDNSARASRIGSAIIEQVRKVTKIAADPKILGAPNEDGIVYFDCIKSLPGLCMMYPPEARYAATTEVWPDVISPAEALAGQMMALVGALEFNLRNQ